MTRGAIVGALRNTASAIADLFLPELCCVCGTSDRASGGLCEDCSVEVLRLVAIKYCPRCGASLGENLSPREDGCWLCPDPLPRFKRVVRLGPYESGLRRMVLDMKHHRLGAMRQHLADMLCSSLATHRPESAFDLVVPVPSHWRRRLGRGCDHAYLLARRIAQKLSLPIGQELVRVRHTPPQIHLPRTGRIENVRGAFAPKAGAKLDGAHVLLVDDVTTTGATANEASRTLLSAGASCVTLAVVAKAEPPKAYASSART